MAPQIKELSVHHRSKSSHYYVVPPAEAAAMPRAAAMGDLICNQLRKKHPNQKLYQSIANARGDDDDRRQIIADLISDDRSPFTPDDEEALRFMSDKALMKMHGDFLKANSDVTQFINDAIHRQLAPALKKLTDALKAPIT